VRFHQNACFGITFGEGRWLQALAGLTAHLTSLDLTGCVQVLDDGLRASLAGLTTLTSLNLACCHRVSNVELRALAGLTALTSLDLSFCGQVSDDGLRSLASLPSMSLKLMMRTISRMSMRMHMRICMEEGDGLGLGFEYECEYGKSSTVDRIRLTDLPEKR